VICGPFKAWSKSNVGFHSGALPNVYYIHAVGVVYYIHAVGVVYYIHAVGVIKDASFRI